MAAKSASGAGTPSKLSLKKKTKTRPLSAKEVSVTKKFGNYFVKKSLKVNNFYNSQPIN